MAKNKPILAILTESIRRDNHVPLKYFKNIDVYHFYKNAPYHEMTEEEMKGAIKYDNYSDLKRKIIKLNPDIIQGAEPYGSKNMFLLSYFAYSMSKELNAKLIFPFLENRPAEIKLGWLKHKIAYGFLKKYVTRAELIFYLNEGAKKNLLDAGAEPKKMIKFLWGIWGVDTDLFVPAKKEASCPVILFGGRLDRAKGIEYVMYAFLLVKKQIPNAKLVLIGSGELDAWAHEFVREKGIEKDVQFAGIIKTKDLPKYLHNSRIFTCPSITLSWWEEQVGMINLQAMSTGVPVVSTKSGGIPEYVLDGKHGILVPEKDAKSLASAIEKLLTDDELRHSMEKNARSYTLEHYSDQKNILSAEKILLKLINHE